MAGHSWLPKIEFIDQMRRFWRVAADAAGTTKAPTADSESLLAFSDAFKRWGQEARVMLTETAVTWLAA